MRHRHFAMILAVCAATSGCASLPGEPAAIAAFSLSQKNAALAAQESGDLARAVNLWRSLLLLEQTRAEAAQALSELDREIEKQVATQLRAAENAYRRGNTRSGDQHMLAVLALQPGQPQALERLSTSALGSARAKVKARTPDAYVLQANPAEATTASLLQELSSLEAKGDYSGLVSLAANSEAELAPAEQRLLRNAHIALADAAEQSGNLDVALEEIQAAMIALPQQTDPLVDRTSRLRNDLSQAAYRKGSRLMQRDLDGAIDALESALRYNPYNGDARRKLDQANTLQRNLRKIEGSR